MIFCSNCFNFRVFNQLCFLIIYLDVTLLNLISTQKKSSFVVSLLINLYFRRRQIWKSVFLAGSALNHFLKPLGLALLFLLLVILQKLEEGSSLLFFRQILESPLHRVRLRSGVGIGSSGDSVIPENNKKVYSSIFSWMFLFKRKEARNIADGFF